MIIWKSEEEDKGTFRNYLLASELGMEMENLADHAAKFFSVVSNVGIER